MPAKLELSLSSSDKEIVQELPKEEPENESENKDKVCKWIMHVAGTKENRIDSPQNKLEELRAWHAKQNAVMKEPLGVSQRLNISG